MYYTLNNNIYTLVVVLMPLTAFITIFNTFRPEFANVISIHYKPRISVVILDL